jgi:hypothetical protein
MGEQSLAELVSQLLLKLDITADFKTQLALLSSHVAILGENVCNLTGVVKGNGKPGHADRIRDLEEDVKDLKVWHGDWKKEREEQKQEMRGIRNALLISVVMLVITTLVNIFIK